MTSDTPRRSLPLPGRDSARALAAVAGTAFSWIEWDIDLSAVRCPVLLWYGTDDRFVPLARGLWLSQQLADARLVVHEGEGHLGIFEHMGEMLDALTEPARSTQPAPGDLSSAAPPRF